MEAGLMKKFLDEMEAGLMIVIMDIGRLLTNVKYGIEDIQIYLPT